MGFDLHTHSTFSDGTDSPEQLMQAALRAGLDGVAIVDHDSTDGWAEAERARPPSLVLVRGIELSTRWVVAGRHFSVHLLAYLCDPRHPGLVARLERLRADRLARGMEIVDRMVADGIEISRQQVLDIAAGAPVGRPHIGRALVAAGRVSTVTEAFGSYLAAHGPYYVRKADIDLLDAIELVRATGGVPVMAHPRSRGARQVTDAAMIGRCVAAGLAGVECDYPDHTDHDRRDLRRLAGRLGIIATGSSDYHGTNKAIRIGQETSPCAVLDAIAAAATSTTTVLGPDG